MQENLKEILTHLNPEIDQETLLLYLQEKLDGDRKHEVEKQLADNDFASEALEGLVELKDQRRINVIVDQLNRDLKKKVERKKQRREKMKIKDLSWLYISVIIVLLLLIISYMLVHRSAR